MTNALKMQKRTERLHRIGEMIVAAEHVACACCSTGSWTEEDRVYGTSGDRDVVWAGCPNCRGTAIGSPISAVDLAWAERQPEALAAARRKAEIKRAILAVDIADAVIDWATWRGRSVTITNRSGIPVGEIRVSDDMIGRLRCYV